MGRCPAIYVRLFSSTFIYFIMENYLPLNVRACKNKFRIITQDAAVYQRIVEFLQIENQEFYTFSPKPKKTMYSKMILRGLPFVNKNTLVEELAAFGIVALKVYRLNKGSDLWNSPMSYLVKILNADRKKVQLVSSLFDRPVWWERVVKVTQCRNCYNFGHSAHFCFMNPRCIRCGEEHNHLNSTCLFHNSHRLLCINCGQTDHLAFSYDCPRRKQQLQFMLSAPEHAKRSTPLCISLNQ